MRRVIAIFSMPERMNDKVTYFRSIATRMAENPIFADRVPPDSVFLPHVEDFAQAQVATLTGTHGLAAERDAKFVVAKTDLMMRKSYVQKLADTHGNAHDAAAIIESAGFTVMASTGHGRADFKVKRGKTKNSVYAYVKSPGRGAHYDWQYSVDQVNWPSAGQTDKAHVDITELLSAQTYFFRYRVFYKGAWGNWSRVISFIVG